MDTYNNRPSVLIAGPEKVEELQEMYSKAYSGSYDEEEDTTNKREYSALATYIQGVYQENKDTRSSSGIEDKMLQSLRAYNGHYDPEDLARIRESGGSEIFMNLTPTKCRAAMSWLRDIMMPAKEYAWGLYPTDVPELPPEIRDQIEVQINELVSQSSAPEQAPEGQPQEPVPPSRSNAMGATQKLQEINQLKRDIEDAISDEIYKVALSEVKKYEKIVADQLQEGDWEKAFSDFIEDFCVFQVAIMKAPVITKKKRLTYVDGRAQEIEDFVFLNKRVSPLDIYPSANATSIQEGDLCEHLRFDRKTLYNLIGVPNYKEDAIRKVLEYCKDGYNPDLDSTVESEKAEEEYRGDLFRASKNTIHGVHFHGSIGWKYLNDWGFTADKIGTDEDREFEVEAILAGGEVIKCVLNSDPLLRRPYYKASWQNIPGSWWGRSLPELMRDIQRMCNATARALANNMAIASGPQIEVYVDRLADDSEIDDISPFHVWQLTSDPSGAGGRAINFWQPISNAQELLAVYKEFELRADDATGIPRYAYGNDQSKSGAAQTASGLSMLLESAAKGIKDSVRNVDFGIIKPRIEYQFYWNVISNDDVKFTGDVNVVPKGSEILTMKGASEMRRNEFLQILSNPEYMSIVGIEGIADILREMAKTLGLGNNIIPSRIELKKKQEESAAQQAQAQQHQMDMEMQKSQTGLQATQMQVQGQVQMHQGTQQLKAAELQQRAESEERDRQLKAIEIQQKAEAAVHKETSQLQKQQMIEANKQLAMEQQIALSLQTDDKVNQQ